MTNANETPNGTAEPDGSGRVFFAGSGFLMLLISLFVTCVLLFAERPEGQAFPQGALEAIAFGLLLAFSWLLTAACFLSASGRRRLRQVSDWCGTVASGSLLMFLFTIALKSVLTPETGESPLTSGSPPMGGAATAAVLIVFVFGAGLLMHMQGKTGRWRGDDTESAKSSLSTVFFWPLLVVLKAPAAGTVFLLLFGGAVYLGERIGTYFAHPLLGACGGLGTALAVVWTFGGPNRERTGENREKRKRDA